MVKSGEREPVFLGKLVIEAIYSSSRVEEGKGSNVEVMGQFCYVYRKTKSFRFRICYKYTFDIRDFGSSLCQRRLPFQKSKENLAT